MERRSSEEIGNRGGEGGVDGGAECFVGSLGLAKNTRVAHLTPAPPFNDGTAVGALPLTLLTSHLC